MASRGLVRIASLLAIALLPMIALAQAEPSRGKAELAVRGKTIDQRIAEFMAANDVPGLAMAIVQAPYIPRSAGYGRASLAHDELASTRTMWAIGPMVRAPARSITSPSAARGSMNSRIAWSSSAISSSSAWCRSSISTSSS